MDFVHDQLFDTAKVRVLNIVDAFTKYVPAIEPRFNWRGTGVVEVPERVCKAQDNNHAALASAILQQPSIDPVCSDVCGADAAAKISAVDLNLALKACLCRLLRHGFTELVHQHKRCLVLKDRQSSARESASASGPQ